MNTNFKQTDIGLIPDDWEVRKVQDAFTFTKKPRILEIDNDFVLPFIPMEMILENKVYVEDFKLKKFGSFSSGTYFENGDILLAKITPSFENGKQAIARIPYKFGYATTEVIPVNEIKDISSKYFLFNYLLKADVRKRLAGKMEGSTGRQRLPKTVLQNTSIPLPPLPEQKKIAHVLSQIQKAIETQEQIIKTSQELKKALMQKLFTEGLNGEPQKPTEIGLIPESWEVALIKDYGIVKSNSFSFTKIPTIDSHKNEDDKVLAIKVSDMNLPGNENILSHSNIEFHVSKSNLIKLKPIPIHSIIFPKRGAAISTNKKRMNNHLVILDPNLIAIIPNKDIIPKYLFYWFLTFDIGRLKDDNPIPQLNKKDVDNVKFPLPKRIEEQNEIINILDSISMNLYCQISKCSSLRDLFKSNLNLLMTGQIRLKDIELELEESLKGINA